MKKDEAKTCEERVLAELGEAEATIAALKEENGKLAKGIQYGDAVLGVLRQICTLEDVDGDDGSLLFKGVYRFDKKRDAQLIELLRVFRVEKEGAPEVKGDVPEEKK